MEDKIGGKIVNKSIKNTSPDEKGPYSPAAGDLLRDPMAVQNQFDVHDVYLAKHHPEIDLNPLARPEERGGGCPAARKADNLARARIMEASKIFPVVNRDKK